ncbi:aspartate--tRNA ligase [Marinoscillum furvescens]|uniref:Aspartate--tRNA ligase n=1 Tax=Marinoscillum furvescens DSM 4134 TaxID=1122208 RepID=A0A3D9L3W2_MARFU|nr:aspartate--tRNA ligase [Marinoscillum furvescens]RED99880.1 aspartyl-tRNA synthetase [Marinoscillum furvescens DSM 4134]
MLRTHTCGELRSSHIGEQVTLAGWVQKVRDKGGMIWIDVRDRYGVTQLMFDEGSSDKETIARAREVGREFVIAAKGEVIERVSKNAKIPTGDVEIKVAELTVLNESKTPPFIIDDETDGGEDLRAKYRYLDLRRNIVRKNLEMRHQLLQKTRAYLSENSFMEVETPYLIKSTPEGARDFVVPSRMNPNQFYALPQSPQTFKQLLMVSGFDRYFQIVKCFRDEDLRADRQPEFTQIDCEMSFVTREDILNTFEGMIKYLFKEVKGVDLGELPHIPYAEAMSKYGSDKPDLRFGMEFHELNDVAQGAGFVVFDSAELVVGINAEGCAEYTRKQLDELTNFVKKPQIGAKGLVYVKCNADGTFKSSVDKFFDQDALKKWAEKFGAKPGDLLLILAGDAGKTRKALNELRLEMGTRLGLRDKNTYAAAWVVDFPLLEWDEETERYHAMHHPFTSPNPDDFDKLVSDPGSVRANAYDMVVNGVELGGGSIRIHDRNVQSQMFDALGFTKEEAQEQFGFLMSAFEYGAPPHGGIAFGFDRLCALFGGQDSIRDFIAFPKNTSGRDVMIDSPSVIDTDQLEELHLKLTVPSKSDQ